MNQDNPQPTTAGALHTSTTLAAIAPALVRAQAEFKPVAFDTQNAFLKNKYATLGAVIDATRPILAKHGLAVSQFICTPAPGCVGVQTVLIHDSGEWMSGACWIEAGQEKGKSAAQVAGSIITYLRRYGLASILGVYSDEDTDGNPPAPQQQAQRQPAQQAQQAARPAQRQQQPQPQQRAAPPEWADCGDPAFMDAEQCQTWLDWIEANQKGHPRTLDIRYRLDEINRREAV